jgi:iron-sulfur cluster assembly accessory protein
MDANIVTLTDAAVSHIQKMFKEQDIGFRLSVKQTGCSGLAYVPNIVSQAIEQDLAFVSPQGLRVFIDPACVDYVKNLTIDYIEEVHVGLKQKRLVFINPNEKNRCGCGESFTVE